MLAFDAKGRIAVFFPRVSVVLQMQMICRCSRCSRCRRTVLADCWVPGWTSGEELTDFPSGKAMWQVYASAVEAPNDSRKASDLCSLAVTAKWPNGTALAAKPQVCLSRNNPNLMAF